MTSGIRFADPAGPAGGVAGAVADRVGGRDPPGGAGGRDRLVHPPGGPRRAAGARDQKPQPGRDQGSAARHRAGQPGGEPARRCGAASRRWGAGMGHRDPDRGPGDDLAAADVRGAGLAGAGLAGCRRRDWSQGPPSTGTRAVIPVWRDPWMVVGSATFTGDVAARLGLENVYGADPGRYPHIELDDLAARQPDLIVLPDEPYAFSPTTGRRCFPSAGRAGRGPRPDLVRAVAGHGAVGTPGPARRGPAGPALTAAAAVRREKRMAPSSSLPCRSVTTSLR